MRKFAILVILAGAVIIGWLYWDQARSTPLIVSGFIEAYEIRVGSRVGGRVSEVFVDEGSLVKTGQQLYTIDPFDLEEQSAEARAQLAANEAERDRLKAGYRKEEIEEARSKRDQAAAKQAKLVAGPRKQEIEIARSQLEAAKASQEEAESEYDRLNRLKTESQAAPR